MATNDFVLAADVGGTHITAALIDITNRKIVLPSLVRSSVDANGSADQIIQSWSQCMLAAKSGIAILKVCLAMPGPFNYEEGTSWMKGQGKYDALYGMNVKQLLAAAMQTEANQIFAENDAACFLQGEVFAGCATDGFEKLIGVTLGTGLGTAVYEKGKSRSADLWSFPFHETIVEDYLSTRWFVQRYAQLTGKKVKGVKEIVEKAGKNTVVRSIFNEFAKNLAEFLLYFTGREEAEAIVIGGNISKAYELFQTKLEEGMLDDFPSVQIRKSALGEQAALFGAVGSWYNTVHKSLSVSQ
jgi:glucokinase